MKKIAYCLISIIVSAGLISCGGGGGGTDDEKSYKNVTTYCTLPIEPKQVINDSAGNLFVTAGFSSGNYVIYKVDVSGTVSVFSDDSLLNVPHGITVDSNDNLFIGNSGDNNIIKITSSGTASEFIASGTFNDPYGTVVFNDTLYVADPNGADGWIRETDIDTKSTNPFAGFNYVYSVKVDSSGNVYASSGAMNIIKKYSSDGTLVTTYTVTSATTPSLYDIAIDSSGDIYAADYENCVIWKVDTSGNISQFAGTLGEEGDIDGELMSSEFDSPRGITIDSEDNIFIVDQQNSKIRKIALE